MTTTPRSNDDVERVLVVAAHPDDADFGAAGTVATWASAGIEVTLLCLTHGEQGARPDADISELARVREVEQRAASAKVGISDVRFLTGHRDGWVEPSFELQRDIVQVIREVRPQRVLCQSPERWYDRLMASHPDHLAAGEATVRACYPAAENPFAWPELELDFWRVGEIWLMAHPDADHAVDITDTFEAKVDALQQHASQTAHREQLAEMLRSWSTGVAERFGLPQGRLAEAFKFVPLN
ncbi:MAG: PIG-L deacetylase family protein [Ornithinimicrobium sp.]